MKHTRSEWLVIGLAAIVVVVILVLSHDSNPLPTRYAEAKANAAGSLPACRKEDKNIQLTGSEQTALEQVVVAQLTDVPAGTSVNIQFEGRTQDTMTGSAIYPPKYGSYNFTVQKDHSQLGWKVTAYKACQR